MGLFDSLVAEPTVQAKQSLTEVEAFAGVLFAAALADGEVSEDEQGRLNSFLTKNKFFLQAALTSSGSSGDYTNRLVEKMSNLYPRKGHEPFIEMCAQSLPQKWKKPTFAILAELLFSDGKPCQANIDTLNITYKMLEISSEEAVSIVNVIKLLHYFES